MTDAPETTGRQQGDSRFQPGQSGNPNGRPKGARHKTTVAMEALLDGQATALTQKAIDLALAGEMQALRICIDRLAPPRRDRPVILDLPDIETVQDLPKVTRAILVAVSTGELTPSEAAELGRLVDAHAKAIEVTELDQRLADIERRMESKS